MFERLTDVRNQSYVKYSMSVIFVTRLLGLLCGKTSMRNLTESMNTDICIENISRIVGIKLEEIPHYDTINNVFEQVEIEEICELKAFYRMSKRIKKNYPKMNIVISGDALYGNNKVMQMCKENKWEYIIRLKDNQTLLVEEVKGVEKAENTVQKIKYWNELEYGAEKKEKKANVIKCYEERENKTIEFMWITSFEITETNKKEIIYFGKQRWRIENEGFNMQKTGTFNIEHMYSKNYNAMKVHYFLIQFAHTLRQLLEKGIKYVQEIKMSIKEVSAAITQTLTKSNLAALRKVQLRFRKINIQCKFF